MQVEEAAVVAQEYISTLDNLPAEVQHLLAEIRDRENKVQALLHNIQTKTQSYIRNSLTGQVLSAKEASVPQKCADEWFQIEQYADEKVQLANRIVELLTKACGRLDVDLARILQPGAADFSLATSANDISGSTLFGRGSGLDDMQRGLRGALGTPDGSPPHMSGPPLKRRRLTHVASSQASPSPSITAARDRGRARNRGSTLVDALEEPDEEDVAENDDGDDTLYCFCQKPSYDEMIACDASDCPYEWFHVTCVGMVGQNPDTWYCPECAPKMEGEKRKGRRK
ncbi:hypothetical protein EXIGLDRAFT_267189 [Exidia glandulosa HHB12029]|uniref:Chromatin modification-related protein n=1 Tax=Exidia glandulosa HHB12029 TaxID=1314781 RepID=A0A165MBK6_EXIGL|nr:hypothetical protein EXIGLDRAFT_267189 [Exidia glandulosa HHB12029]